MANGSPRAQTRLWLVALLVLAAVLWQYARSNHAPAPDERTSTSAATVTPNAPAPTAAPADRHDLSADETLGGHTLARHVGRTDQDLAERLERERGISAASTYTDRAAAATTVERALSQNEGRIRSWLSRDGSHPNLALDYRGQADQIIGRSLRRGRTTTVPCTDAVVVLRWTRGDRYYVLTSYPEARR